VTFSAAALGVSSPLALWGLLLAVPIVLLHLHHRHRVVVPFLGLVSDALGPRRPGGGWRRLREAGSLLARLLALAAAVLALAGLSPVRGDPPPESLFVVVDADVTTGVREPDGRSRLSHAVRLAGAFVRAEAWAEVGVLAAGATPEVWVPVTADREGAARRLAAHPAVPAPGTADLGAAVAAAHAEAAGRERARVLVLTARDVALPAAPPGVRLEVHGTGRARADQGFQDLRIRREPGAPAARLEAEVRNDDPAPTSRGVVVRVDGQPVAREVVALGPGPSLASVSFDLAVPREGAWVDLALEGDDAFPFNDLLSLRLAPPAHPSVLVVHGGAVRPYTAAILTALGDAIDLARTGLVRAADLPRAGPHDVVIVDGVPLPPGALRPGAWIFLAPLGGELPFTVGEPVEEPLLWRTAPDHPLVRDLDLTTVFAARSQSVSGEGLVSLAEADGRTVLAEGEREGVRYVALALDPEGSDLPVRAALPLLVRGALRRLADAPLAPLAPFHRVGRPLRPDLPLPGGPRAVVTWPGGEAEVACDPEGPAWIVPPGAHGRVEVVTGAGERAWRGATAFVDLDPARTVAPARPEAVPPPPREPPGDPALRWRLALVAAALALLAFDLLLLALAVRPARAVGPAWAPPS
jgi:hypothetical protein